MDLKRYGSGKLRYGPKKKTERFSKICGSSLDFDLLEIYFTTVIKTKA